MWIETGGLSGLLDIGLVTPLAGVWIETLRNAQTKFVKHVTPLAGVWIETSIRIIVTVRVSLSLPLRECGLKQVGMHIMKSIDRKSVV